MEKFKKILKFLLYPKFYIAIPLVLISAGRLVYTFVFEQPTESPVAIISYVLSFYSLTVICAGAIPLYKKTMAFLHENKYTSRLLSDAVLRAKLSLLFSLIFNIGYASLNMVLGILENSIWLIAIAGYYGAVALVRFGVTLGVREAKSEADRTLRLRGEWQRYRVAGIASLFMTLTMSVMIGLVLIRGEGFRYPGYFIFIFAAYTFIKFAASIVNTVKFRKLDTPVLSAAKAMNLSVAVMSIFTLQTAMLAEFASGDSIFTKNSVEQMSQTDIDFMNTATGIAVWCTVHFIAIYMIIRANRKLKEMENK